MFSNMARYKVAISKAVKSKPRISENSDIERNKSPAERQTETTLQHKVSKLTSLLKAEKRCHRSVGYKNSVSRFHILALSNCRKIGKEITNGTYNTKIGDTFPIYEPKFRMVTSTPYRDRIPQSSFVTNYVYPEIIPTLTPHNFACRKNGGVEKARNTFKEILKYAPQDYVCVCTDFKSYFPSIVHETLFKVMFGFVNDEWAKNYYKNVVNANKEEVGLTLGSEINQLSAVIFTHSIDDILDTDNCYVKYMDDIRYVTDKYTAEFIIKLIGKECTKLNLTLNKKKSYIQPLSRPVSFLGFTYLKNGNRVTMKRIRSKLKRSKTKYKRMVKKGVPQSRLSESLRSSFSTIKKGNRADVAKFNKFIKSLSLLKNGGN